jgi:hypothetical protein
MRRLELMATDAHERVRLEVLAAAGSFAATDTPAAIRLVHRVLLSPLDATLERVAKETLRQLEPDPSRMLLPSDPGVLGFVLGRLSDVELSKAPGAEPVWLAQLERAGIPAAAKEAALRSLAKARNTSFVAELALALIRLDGADSSDTLTAPLLDLLVLRQPAELKLGHRTLQKLAASAKPGRLRSAALAAWLQSAPPPDVWAELRNDPQLQAELLRCLVRVADPSVRAACHPILAEVLRKGTDTDGPIYRAALAALPLTGTQFSSQNLEFLSAPLLVGKVLPEAVQSLAQLPEVTLRKANLEKLLGSLNAWMKSQAGPARNSPSFAQTLQLARTLATAWEKQVHETVETIRKQTAPVLVVRTVCDEARFDAPHLSARAGQPLQILFENHDVRPQNFVLTLPGKAEHVLKETGLIPESRNAQEKPPVPPVPGVVAASRLLAPGEQQLLELNALPQAGDYEYLSTVPGQPKTPRGVLRVLP